jgi:hypothetical protein
MDRIARNAVAAVASALLSTGALALDMGLATPAQSFTISQNSGGWSLVVGGTVDITALSANSLTVHVVLNNLSTLGNGDQIARPKDVRLSSFGFGVDPNASAVGFGDDADGGMVNAALGSLPSLASVEVCAFGGPNCSGGGNGGIRAGAFDEFDLILAGTWGDTVTFDPLGVKFQTTNGSYEFSCTESCGGGGGGGGASSSGPIPEPQTYALTFVALASLMFLRRRQRAVARR